MPTKPPLLDPKGENHWSNVRKMMPLWKQPPLWQIIGLHIVISRNVYWNKSNTVFAGQIQYLEGQSGKKGDTVPPNYTYKLLQGCYPNARQPTLPEKWKAIPHSTMTTAWSSCKAIWGLYIKPDQDPLPDNDNSEPWK